MFSLCIFLDGYLFQFYIEAFLIISFLLKSHSPLPLTGEKADHSNNNN